MVLRQPEEGRWTTLYLKTILLQFLEQRDKKRQADLVKTVLGQLLHFDKYVLPSIRVLIFVTDSTLERTKRNGLRLFRAK